MDSFDPYTQNFVLLHGAEKSKNPFRGLNFLAPRVGIEPTTNRLHRIQSYFWYGLYHHPSSANWRMDWMWGASSSMTWGTLLRDSL